MDRNIAAIKARPFMDFFKNEQLSELAGQLARMVTRGTTERVTMEIERTREGVFMNAKCYKGYSCIGERALALVGDEDYVSPEAVCKYLSTMEGKNDE